MVCRGQFISLKDYWSEGSQVRRVTLALWLRDLLELLLGLGTSDHSDPWPFGPVTLWTSDCNRCITCISKLYILTADSYKCTFRVLCIICNATCSNWLHLCACQWYWAELGLGFWRLFDTCWIWYAASRVCLYLAHYGQSHLSRKGKRLSLLVYCVDV